VATRFRNGRPADLDCEPQRKGETESLQEPRECPKFTSVRGEEYRKFLQRVKGETR